MTRLLFASKLALSCTLAFSAFLISCTPEAAENMRGDQEETVSTTEPAPPEAAPVLGSGIELDNMDHTVRAQDHFYRFVNGTWLDQTGIPADRARWGSFDELREQSQEHVLGIILELTDGQHEHGSDSQKIADMYRSFMDTLIIEELGLSPIQPDLDRIDALSSHDDLVDFWGQQQQYRFGTPLNIFVSIDLMQSNRHITSASQSGLGLPDRDFYLRDDERSRQLLDEYRNYIIRLWEAANPDDAGWGDAENAAERILALESSIAEDHWTRVENRDRQATYNKKTVAELSEMAPGFDWQRMLEQAGLGEIDELVVRQPSYFQSFSEMWEDVALEDWKTYLRFHLLRRSASALSSDFADIHFDFYGRVLSGQEEQRSRERRAVSTTESVLGFMVGKEYVERHYPREAADRMADMIGNLKIAFDQSIRELEWMSDATKEEALAKLANFNAKIGYPEVWRDYECVEIHPDDLVGNLRRSSLCDYERNISRLGEEVDREEWGMTPQTVNAYYNVALNEIVFPAAILQPPFFNVEADDAVNYGGIGGVIGHEISHGFDDQGRRSDGDGNLRDWWTEQDESQFQALAQIMIGQYSAYNPIDDMHINGELSLGENIADLGGVNVAFRAWQNSLDGEPSPVLDGFTGEQRFFMGWGQIWRIKFRDESLRRQLVTGPHSPGEYRVTGILSNMPEFYKAFDVQPGDPMYRDEEIRVRIW